MHFYSMQTFKFIKVAKKRVCYYSYMGIMSQMGSVNILKNLKTALSIYTEITNSSVYNVQNRWRMFELYGNGRPKMKPLLGI